MPDIINSIMNLISPREAEAKIVGSKAAIQSVQDILTNSEQNKGQYLPDMYDKIVRYANEVPQTVEIRDAPGLSDVYGAAGDFENGKIHYDPKYKGEDLYNTLSHELLHFLNSISKKPQDVKEQHSLIKDVLGTDRYVPAAQLQGYQAPVLNEQQIQMLNNLFGK